MIKKLLVLFTAASALLFAGSAAYAGTIVCFPSGECINVGDPGIFP
ncbi:hypothetical protein [Burkholderia stagnalis]|nr:hypothetical protein [Burkholderia stagnalis]